MPRIIDVISFNGEYDLFDIRYNILKDYVDEFIVCEARTTFSGNTKQLYFPKGKYKDVKYHVIDEQYTYEELKQAENSPNTEGAKHWETEFLQKESIKKALTHLQDDDIVFIGDCDEIWERFCKELNFYDGVLKLPLRVYTYYLNNRSSEQFWGTIVGHYKNIKDKCLNHLRTESRQLHGEKDGKVWQCGWHFTSMRHDLKRKLEDSYTRDSYATDSVMKNLEANIKNDRDFLGRDFTYKVDESEWPEYLKNNRHLYEHLLK